jgi:hypothetical protein
VKGDGKDIHEAIIVKKNFNNKNLTNKDVCANKKVKVQQLNRKLLKLIFDI